MFERVCEEVLNITGLVEAERNTILNLFESNLTYFCEAVASIMAQIVLWKRANLRPLLDEIKMAPMFQFLDGRLYTTQSYETVEQRVEHAAKSVELDRSAEAELGVAEAEFRAKQGLEKFVRGKYLLWFFVQNALALHAAIPKYCTRHPRPPKIHVTFGPTNAMVLLGPRVRLPLSLRQFIDRTYLEYIASC